MELNILFEYAREYWPTGAWVALAVLITWKVGKFYHTRFKKVENGYTEQGSSILKLQELVCSLSESRKILPCGYHGQQINAIQETLKELTRAADELRAFLAGNDSDAANFFSRKHSPRVLNELGVKLYKDAMGEVFLNANKEMLFAKMDERNPQTALDVEMYANEILFICSRTSIFNYIKDFIYYYSDLNFLDKEGRTLKRSVTIRDVCFVMSLPLRDMYLKYNLNIFEAEKERRSKAILRLAFGHY